MSHLIISANSANLVKIRISPSAKAIFNLLEEKRAPTAVKDIVRELPYSERTIQYGLKQLQNYKLVEKRANLQDLRESLYLLSSKTLFQRLTSI